MGSLRGEMQGKISDSLSTLDWISVFGAASSLILALLAIWLAVYFYKESKKSEREISDLLCKLNAQTDLLQTVTGKMLSKYVNYSTHSKPADEITQTLARIVESQNTTSQALPSDGATVDNNEQVMQELTTLYIAVYYHSAIANISLQNSLPSSIGELGEDLDWLKESIDSSSVDFNVATRWLEANGGRYIENSSAYHYYQKLHNGTAESNVLDTANFYRQSHPTSE